MIFNHPLETQAVVATLAPFVYGPEAAWAKLLDVFQLPTGTIGPRLDAAFCAYPAYSVLQSFLAQDLGGPAPRPRETLFVALAEQFGVNRKDLRGDQDARNWTVNEAVLTPVDKLYNKGQDNSPTTLRARILRKVVNTEVDCVLEGEQGILFIEAKLTSPLSMDTKLGLSQLRAQALNAAMVEWLTTKPTALALLGVDKDQAQANREHQPSQELRVASVIWRRADEILDNLRFVSWAELSEQHPHVPEPGAQWLRRLATELKIFTKGDRSFQPVAQRDEQKDDDASNQPDTPPPADDTRCQITAHPHITPGWACCECRSYNGLQRQRCKRCDHTACFPMSELEPYIVR